MIVRHGESNFNILSKIQGRGNYDRPELQSVLTDKGKQQAKLAGKALANLNIDVAYASPLVRAQNTAQIILAENFNPPELITADGLLEIDLSEWESMIASEVKEQFPEKYDRWQNAPETFQLGDRYPILDLFEQAKGLWAEILPKHQDKTILLVGHSGINRALICSAIGIPVRLYHNIQQVNCAITVLNFQGSSLVEGVQLESLNLASHLADISGSPLPPVKKNHDGPRLLLVRHGETEWNRQKRFQGQIDVPLNNNGHAQARRASEFLANTKIDKAFSSPMLRPKDTALEILSKHPNIKLELFDELKEISHGLWEGKFEHEIEAEFTGQLALWQSQPETVQMPEGENLQQVWERVALIWQKIVESVPAGETALVVAHDAVNKAILCLLFDFTPEQFWVFKQGNGGVSVIDYPKGAKNRPILQSGNITTHLSEGVLDRTAAGAL
ncbi:histidine phosphatase family protein [Pseudanabaena sp. 'Roaring Creek']|uniref:histidine phosphatase family protein n=1 Tax=Pseudanabaena sp. 'Roaring Creek' TaxID=1681830 RepID=UPI0009E857F9|nr:histidine phosphatase family protein [Pseudanabaena sp. 'Roaring Creek']